MGGAVNMMRRRAHDRIHYTANVEKFFRCQISITPFGIFTSGKREVFSRSVAVRRGSAIHSSAPGLNLGLRTEGMLENKEL